MPKFSFLIALFCLQTAFAQKYINGETYLEDLHSRYKEKMCQCYTFSQKNTHYKNDTVSGHSEWHEKIKLPDYFQIQFGDSAKGNYVVFQNDSLYSYKSGLLQKSRTDSSSLLLILGGMFYRSYEDMLARLKAANYATKLISSSAWQNEEIWIIGEEGKNQIYFSKKTNRVVRILEKMNAEDMMDMRFEAYQPWCGGSVETKVSFRRNGHLEQVEEYFDLRECGK